MNAAMNKAVSKEDYPCRKTSIGRFKESED